MVCWRVTHLTLGARLIAAEDGQLGSAAHETNARATMSDNNTPTPAGWYPTDDPSTLRYYDGNGWTDQYKPTGGPAAPIPPQPGGPGPQPQTIIVQEKKKGSAGKIILGLFLFLMLGLVGCIALVATAANEAGEAIDEAQDQRAADEAAVEDNAIITSCEVGDNGWGEVAIEFTNPLDEEKGFIGIEVNFLDGDVVVGSANVNFENLGPGQTARGEGTALDLAEGTTDVTCEVVDGTIL